MSAARISLYRLVKQVSVWPRPINQHARTFGHMSLAMEADHSAASNNQLLDGKITGDSCDNATAPATTSTDIPSNSNFSTAVSGTNVQDDQAVGTMSTSNNAAAATSPQHPCEHLRRYDTYGYKPDPKLSDDENYMEMCMLVTRNSVCNQGHMGCVLVSPSSTPVKCSEDDTTEHQKRIYQGVIGVSTNKPLYTDMDSDVHAEIGAIGEAARRGNITENCTAYIAMPPCKNCFAALLAAGCRRMVTPRTPAKTVARVAGLKGVEMVQMDEDRADGLKARIDALIDLRNSSLDAEERKAQIAAKRKQRKEAQRMKKEKKRKTMEENRKIHEGTNARSGS